MNKSDRAYWVGARVHLQPGTEVWVTGTRHGEVIAVGRKRLTVRLDGSGRTVKVRPGAVWAL